MAEFKPPLQGFSDDLAQGRVAVPRLPTTARIEQKGLHLIPDGVQVRVEIVIDVDPYDTNVVGMIRRVRAAVLNRRRVVLPTVDDDGRRGRRHRL
ncbi:MAG: hypothetical protein R6X31_00850 [Anaerolineae bacterium]